MQRRSSRLSVCAAVISYLVGCASPNAGEPAPTSAGVGAGGEAGGTSLGPQPGDDAGASGASSAGASARADAGDTLAYAGSGGLEHDASAPGPAPAPPDAGGGGDTFDSGAPALPAALVSRLSGLRTRLAELAERTLSFWLEHGPDTEFGGFHGTLNRQGNPIAPDDKGLIQQARHLWMLSTWCDRRQETASVRALAQQTYAFFRASFVDTTDGGFVFKVSRDGSRVVDPKKQLFAESYAIYALATYGRVLGDASARELALSRFASIDASRHDTLNGGYDQALDPGFLSAGAEKDSNTHLHLLEAFSALYEATADPVVGARLSELVDLFATRLRQPTNFVPAEFSASWAPFGNLRTSYGHDLETAWLMLDAARVLGRQGDPGVRSAALAIAAHSAGAGFDTLRGGYFEAGPVEGAANDFDKIWWVQFEALEGLWWAYELSADGTYLDRLERTLEWVEQTEDQPIGEWFAASNPDGSAAGADYKSDEWKASYHSMRALLFLQGWIDDELSPR
jgi:cellobiose epimerase